MTTARGKHRGSRLYLLVYSELITTARHRGTVTYQEIALIMGLPLRGSHMGKQVGSMVGAISEDEHAQGRPMLSAIVVRKSGEPGQGFFRLARDLGKLQTQDKDAKHRFWKKEVAAVHATWQKQFKSD